MTAVDRQGKKAQETEDVSQGTGRFTRSATPATTPETPDIGRHPRPRKQAPGWSRVLLRPFFRYSYTRDAYVLRGVGRKHGPVIRDL